MAYYLILAQSEITSRALGAWLKLLGEYQPSLDNRCIILKESPNGTEEKWVLAYEFLANSIEELSADGSRTIPLNEIKVLVDCFKLTDMDPLSDKGGWESLVSMLILSFPEIQWIFGIIDSKSHPTYFQPDYHHLSSLITRPRRDPLFDPTGLRNIIRQSLNEELLSSLQTRVNKSGREFEESQKTEFYKSLLPIRKEAAAAIDEEASYALYHAYIAYRFGYRADAVRSWALMSHLFSEKPVRPGTQNTSTGIEGHGFDLLLEDVNLNFPDKEAETHLSTFASYGYDGKPGRAKNCPLLVSNGEKENSEFRIIVTSGHSGADAQKMEANREFVEGYKGKAKSGFVLKPVGGMFDLWKEAKLFNRLNPREDSTSAGRYRGQAPGFFWPPIPSEQAEESGGHSAPGKLMLVAQHMLRRADGMRTTANTVEECIRGAVLATDALELLRFQTPTLALQALCLKHEFEVKAEVAFLGVGHHFDLKLRLNELEREIKEASRFFEGRRRRAAELDTLVSIGNRLMLVFREAGQFDEEMVCLVRIRSWHRKLRRKQTRKIVDILANAVMGYAEWLLVSPKRFFGMLCVWFFAMWMLWVVYWLIQTHDRGLDLFIGSGSAAWNSFAVANPNEAKNVSGLTLNIVGSAAGLFHLGVFISYLYSAVSRK